MLNDKNSPQVLSAISGIIKGNRSVSSSEDKAFNETLASRYAQFKPAAAQSQVQVIEEAHLSPKQKKIAKVAGHPGKIDAADFKALRGGAKVEEELTMKERVLKTLGQILDEGRGRPRKNPLPASKASSDDSDDFGDDNGKEADQHIHVQLKKASDVSHHEVKGKDGFKTKGGADVKFDSGTHFVHADHAKKVLTALDRLKPADREKMHAHIQQSHANFSAVHKLVS
jgi:hypothetical protein